MKTDTITELIAELRPTAAENVEEWFSPEAQHALLREITTAAYSQPRTARSRRRSWRWTRRGWAAGYRLTVPLATGGAAVAAAVVLLVGGPSGGPAAARAAVHFRNAANGEIVATITNPYVAEKQLDADFAAHGLHIGVNLVPVSPSLVGTVVYASDDAGANGIQPIQGGSCVTGGGGCPIGLKIPTSFTGQGYITLGRPAQAGESYDSTASALAPGEALHCSGLYGATISAAVAKLKADGLTVSDWRVANQQVSAAPATGYVWQIDPVTASTIRVWTEAAPPPTSSEPAAYTHGCS